MTETYITKIVADGDDLVLILPDEIVRALGLQEGDELIWEIEEAREPGAAPRAILRRADP